MLHLRKVRHDKEALPGYDQGPLALAHLLGVSVQLQEVTNATAGAEERDGVADEKVPLIHLAHRGLPETAGAEPPEEAKEEGGSRQGDDEEKRGLCKHHRPNDDEEKRGLCNHHRPNEKGCF